MNSQEQASCVAVGLVASQAWHRMEKEREAEKVKAGGADFVDLLAPSNWFHSEIRW